MKTLKITVYVILPKTLFSQDILLTDFIKDFLIRHFLLTDNSHFFDYLIKQGVPLVIAILEMSLVYRKYSSKLFKSKSFQTKEKLRTCFDSSWLLPFNYFLMSTFPIFKEICSFQSESD